MSSTDVAATAMADAPAAPAHPLDPLSAAEIRRAREVLVAHDLVGEATRFPLLGLAEPPKEVVLAAGPGEPVDRQAFAVLLDTAGGQAVEALVSLTHGTLVSMRNLAPETDGQPPILLEEFVAVDEIVKDDPRWRAALQRRGVTDLDLVCVCPLSAGHFDLPGEQGRRMLRALSFVQHHPADSPWAHPVDGIVAYVDLTARRVTEVVDHQDLPIPAEEGNYDDEAAVGPPRSTLQPIEITQPQGTSFTVEGHLVRWQNWSLRVGFDPREGLVLHQLTFHDGQRERPVIYRASVAEMVVNYGDPSPVRFWQNYFDTGEYSLGKQANSLVRGCDCLGEIHYFDALVADDHGEPQVIENAVCMHEEDHGVLWKHTDIFTESQQTRRSRRLVISSFVTVGNYDYGFYWYLYLDGTIQLEVKATGVLFTGSYPGDDGYSWGSEVAPGLAAPYHQHLFNARLDMMVDGSANAVDEVEAASVPMGPDNPHGNAITRKTRRLASESQAQRMADNSVRRTWVVVNPDSRNRLGQPCGYALLPQGQPTLLADPASSIAARAAFATRHLWVTRYDQAQRHPAGDYVNQRPGGSGLPEWVAADRSIDGQDIVLWHTFGLTHFPRTEEWPIMPVDYCGFTLEPVGFFDRNPTLDLPASANGH